ncbi:hypothetical protein NDU88_004762 [Pleurodeles waltl]|uniref:Uncharacterized protein n=1 Tax=Pleurodeles waltl TaxID=8319 RepID=A0AAV7NPI2_PLEWA|nr:hypothetical protein NDU88_004762 [Pleurodeles waltl]
MSDTVNEIAVVKAEIMKISMETSAAKFLVHRQEYYEYSEKVSKLLALKIRQKATHSNINILEDEDGQLVSNNLEVLRVLREFYQKLYSQEIYLQEDEVTQYMANISVGQLQEGEKNEVEAPLSDKEIGAAVSTLSSGKAAGPDKIPFEFSIFWGGS